MMVGHCGQRSHGARKGESSPAPMRQVVSDRTRVSSQRQLPTDHDYAGGQQCSIREYQSDQTVVKSHFDLCLKCPTQGGENK